MDEIAWGDRKWHATHAIDLAKRFRSVFDAELIGFDHRAPVKYRTRGTRRHNSLMFVMGCHGVRYNLAETAIVGNPPKPSKYRRPVCSLYPPKIRNSFITLRRLFLLFSNRVPHVFLPPPVLHFLVAFATSSAAFCLQTAGKNKLGYLLSCNLIGLSELLIETCLPLSGCDFGRQNWREFLRTFFRFFRIAKF